MFLYFSFSVSISVSDCCCLQIEDLRATVSSLSDAAEDSAYVCVPFYRMTRVWPVRVLLPSSLLFVLRKSGHQTQKQRCVWQLTCKKLLCRPPAKRCVITATLTWSDVSQSNRLAQTEVEVYRTRASALSSDVDGATRDNQQLRERIGLLTRQLEDSDRRVADTYAPYFVLNYLMHSITQVTG
jgi:hypothetical protein